MVQHSICTICKVELSSGSSTTCYRCTACIEAGLVWSVTFMRWVNSIAEPHAPGPRLIVDFGDPYGLVDLPMANVEHA